jgi:hypothetical protein
MTSFLSMKMPLGRPNCLHSEDLSVVIENLDAAGSKAQSQSALDRTMLPEKLLWCPETRPP